MIEMLPHGLLHLPFTQKQRSFSSIIDSIGLRATSIIISKLLIPKRNFFYLKKSEYYRIFFRRKGCQKGKS